METIVESNSKAPFSIATTPRCRGGYYSFPWIAPLYLWSLHYSAKWYISSFFSCKIQSGFINYHDWSCIYQDRNETLICFKIVSLSFNILISSEFSIGQIISEISVFIWCEAVSLFFFEYPPHPEIFPLRWMFC